MRYVDINSIENLEELKAKINRTKQWKHAKDPFSKLSSGTCWYCENYIPDSGYAEIDHWRPKDLSMYPWLKLEITNFIYSCNRCNNAKRSKFPLSEDSTKATCNSEISQEIPLLLNPCRKEDVRSICYDNTGRLRARNDNAKIKVEKTREILKLEAPERLLSRNSVFKDINDNLNNLLKYKLNQDLSEIFIQMINNKISDDSANRYVWSLCMYIESWLRENEENFTEIPIRDKINFPQDFCEIYLGIT